VKRISRRSFALGAVGSAAAASTGWRAWDAWIEVPLHERRDDDPLAALGRAFLADHPDERDLDRLRRLVPQARLARTRADVRAVLPRIAAEAEQDFDTHDVSTVGAWRLARIEARAAAMVALLP